MADLNYPSDLKYAKSDEWVRIEGDIATIGISDYAQDALNDIVYAELIPGKDEALNAGDAIASIESVKAASEVYSPVSGTVIEVNTAIVDNPELLNTDPYGKGWMVKIKLDGAPDLSTLLDSAAYAEFNSGR